MRTINLKNNITVAYEQKPDTPRTALSFYLALQNPEKTPGLYSLLTRLFFQGTTKHSAKKIAEMFENNAIDLYGEYKSDFIRFKALCLNEDIDLTIDLLSEIINCSTFKESEKEKIKLRGEIIADKDSPKNLAFDKYYETLFKDHPYANGYDAILANLDKITHAEIFDAYNDILKTSNKIISVVGDFSEDKMTEILNQAFGELPYNPDYENKIPVPELTGDKVIFYEKEDANQAQVLKGRIFPAYGTRDYATITVMNAILSTAGLSSRLFTELREKQGLAYTVRSSYEPHAKCAAFTAYIGTEPSNIKKALDGFDTEMNKLASEKVSDEELENAKNSVIGKRCFFTETNAAVSSLTGLYLSAGLGANYEEKFVNEVENVTKDDILNFAAEYFKKPSVTVVLAPKKYKNQI